MKINLGTVKYTYDKVKKTFFFSEKDIRFDTTYELVNPKTNGTMTFKFSKSTGPEFDPKTQWIYTNTEGYKMIVSNDPRITNQRAQDYIKAKTRYESRLKLSTLLEFDEQGPPSKIIGSYLVKYSAHGSLLITLANVKRYTPIIDILHKRFAAQFVAQLKSLYVAIKGRREFTAHGNTYDIKFDGKSSKVFISTELFGGKRAMFAVSSIPDLIEVSINILKRM